MISKLPVPINLVKNTLGIRDSSDIFKVSIEGDVLYLYIVSDGESAAESELSNSNKRLELTYSVGAHETSISNGSL